MRQPAKLNATVFVYGTNNPDNVIVEVEYKKVLGNGAVGFDFNTGYRISEAYAKLAKTLEKNIRKGKK